MYVMNKDALDKVEDLRRGLHVAMTALITAKDYSEAEYVMKQMDHRLGLLIRETKVVAQEA